LKLIILFKTNFKKIETKTKNWFLFLKISKLTIKNHPNTYPKLFNVNDFKSLGSLRKFTLNLSQRKKKKKTMT